MIRLTVEGRPFWVRPDMILAVGTRPQQTAFGSDGKQIEVPESTMLTISEVGGVPVDEDVSVVLAMMGVEG